MKKQVTVEIPDGLYCTGCLFRFDSPRFQQGGWIHGCNYLHCELKSVGDYEQTQAKDKNCPGLN